MACEKLVRLCREVMESRFSEELISRKLELRVVEGEGERVSALMAGLGLTAKGFALVKYVNGQQVRRKVLEGIWDYFRSPMRVKAYVAKEIRGFLEP